VPIDPDHVESPRSVTRRTPVNVETAPETVEPDDAFSSRRDRIDEIERHSEAVTEILGRPPHWLVRWGATGMAAAMALLISLAWLIHYPDVVTASVVVTTPLPPASVVAQASGHLVDVVVREGDVVQRGALLARIENAADSGAVATARAELDAFDDDRPADATASFGNLRLGEVQADYSAFVKAREALGYYRREDPLGVQIRALQVQREPNRRRLESLGRQRDLVAQEITLAEHDLRRTAELLRSQNASVLTLDDRDRVLLEAHRASEAASMEIEATQLELARIEQTLVELGVRDRQQRQDLRMAAVEASRGLRTRLANWERSYVIRAPIAGRISLFRFWSDSQFIRSGEEVMALVPVGAQVPVGRLSMPLSRSGSVRVGQDVFVRLDNYPAERFGLLKGTVAAIAPVPQQARYAVEVTLPPGLVTTFGRTLDYRQEMQGSADILLEDLRLIDRIFYQLRDLFTPRYGTVDRESIQNRGG